MKSTMQKLQKDIDKLERDFVNNTIARSDVLNKKKDELGSVLLEQVNGALIKSGICSK